MQQTIVDGRYSVLHPLGSGGMGHVYLAQDEILDREVALKVLWERLAESEEFVERFRREARSAAALSHPNIVSIYDQGRAEDGTYYIAMEYLPGGTLKERIAREGPLGYREAADVAIQVSEALGAAHRGGVIHRDIKPHNILLTGSGEVKVADFGIARAASQAPMTGTSFILGTAHYLSPEQAKGEPTGPASDLYALGVVLYEMLTGVAPFEAESPIAVALKHVSDPPPSPRATNPEVPEGMDAVVTRLLSKDPADRHADTDELIEDLRKVREGLPPAGSVPATGRERPAAVPARGSRALWSRRRLRSILPVALVLVALASLATALGASGSFKGLYKISGAQPKEQQSAKLTIPGVLGDRREVAEHTLRKIGFVVTVKEKESKEKEKGRVLSQRPGEGEKVGRGSRVSLVVGKGPSLVGMPDLRGLTLTGAEKKLKEVGLKLGREKESPSSSVPEGEISGQSVRAHKKVEKDTAVDVTVSSGPEQQKQEEPQPAQTQAAAPEGPVQQQPAQQTPVQQAPVQQNPVQETTPAPQPVQQTPAPQAPAPQAPVQQVPVQQAPVQQNPVQETTPAPQVVPSQPASTATPQPAPIATPSPPVQQPRTTTTVPAVPEPSPQQQAPVQQQAPAVPGDGAGPSGNSVRSGGVRVTPVNSPKVTVPKVPDIQVTPVRPFGTTGGS